MSDEQDKTEQGGMECEPHIIGRRKGWIALDVKKYISSMYNEMTGNMTEDEFFNHLEIFGNKIAEKAVRRDAKKIINKGE